MSHVIGTRGSSTYSQLIFNHNRSPYEKNMSILNDIMPSVNEKLQHVLVTLLFLDEQSSFEYYTGTLKTCFLCLGTKDWTLVDEAMQFLKWTNAVGGPVASNPIPTISLHQAGAR